MKLTDIDKTVNEGLGDWVKNAAAKSGLLGSDEKLSAQQREFQERIYSIGLRYFKNQLQQNLDRAVKSGFVNIEPSQTQQTQQTQQPVADQGVQVQSGHRLVIPKSGIPQYYKIGTKWYNANNQVITNQSSIDQLEQRADGGGAREERIPSTNNQRTTQRESAQFDFLTMLVENKILNEQESVGEFILDYVNGQTDGVATKSKYQRFITDAARRAEQEYIDTGKISDKTYEQLWSAIYQISQTGGGKSRGSVSSSYSGYVDTNRNRMDDREERNRWKKELAVKLNDLDLNDPKSLSDLTKITRELAQFINTSKNK